MPYNNYGFASSETTALEEPDRYYAMYDERPSPYSIMRPAGDFNLYGDRYYTGSGQRARNPGPDEGPRIVRAPSSSPQMGTRGIYTVPQYGGRYGSAAEYAENRRYSDTAAFQQLSAGRSRAAPVEADDPNFVGPPEPTPMQTWLAQGEQLRQEVFKAAEAGEITPEEARDKSAQIDLLQSEARRRQQDPQPWDPPEELLRLAQAGHRGAQDAYVRASLWNYEFTAQQKAKIAELNGYRDRVLADPSLSAMQKADIMRQIDATQAGMRPQPVPKDRSKYPPGQDEGEVWKLPSGATVTRAGGQVKLLERSSQLQVRPPTPEKFFEAVQNYITDRTIQPVAGTDGKPGTPGSMPTEEEAIKAVLQRFRVYQQLFAPQLPAGPPPGEPRNEPSGPPPEAIELKGGGLDGRGQMRAKVQYLQQFPKTETANAIRTQFRGQLRQLSETRKKRKLTPEEAGLVRELLPLVD